MRHEQALGVEMSRTDTGSWEHPKGVMLVVLAGLLWSTGGIVVRLIEHATAWHIVLYRSLTLTLTLSIVIFWHQRGNTLRAFRQARVIAGVAGFSLSLGFACWIFALTQTTVANALFLLATQPFMTAILALPILGERVPRLTWITISLALVGVSVMLSEGLAGGTMFGNLMGLGAALGFSGFTVALRKGREVNMFPAVWWAGFFSTLMAAGMLLAHAQSLGIGVWDLKLCTILGVVQVGFGLMAYTAGSRYLPAAELALLAIIEVILGPVWVWIGIGEVPSRFTVMGGMVVLAAVVWRAVYGWHRPPSLSVQP